MGGLGRKGGLIGRKCGLVLVFVTVMFGELGQTDGGRFLGKPKAYTLKREEVGEQRPIVDDIVVSSERNKS